MQQQQQQLQLQQQLLQQKQPNAAFKSSSQENLPGLATSATTATSHSNSFHSSTANAATTTTTQSQSPRLTPSHMKSPRNPVSATQQQYILSRTTPDRSSSSSERKLHQRIKTPTRTPTRTPPATRTPTPTASLTPQHLNSSSSAAAAAAAAAAAVVASSPAVSPITSLICKIELSRLLHIAPEWHTNTYRLYTTATAPPPVAASPRTGHLTPSAASAAGRTPIYDHETILNADLQATQLRLKPSATGTGGSSGRNTPNTASIEQQQQQHQRELSRSRESLVEMGTGKQRFDEVNSNSGRLSSRSVDSVGGGGLTPKELPPPQMPPNGYTARGLNTTATLVTGNGSPSATTKLMLGVKHEHIKFEPDIDTTMAPTAAYCPTDTKFKSSSVVKQELILKQDFKPTAAGELMPPSEKQQLMAVDSPGALISGGDIAKPRRKRSSSSSSSPYKEKKRKKEKDKDKDREKEKDSSLTSKEKEKDKLNSTNNNNSNHRSTIIDDVGMVADVGNNVNCVPQSKVSSIDYL